MPHLTIRCIPPTHFEHAGHATELGAGRRSVTGSTSIGVHPIGLANEDHTVAVFDLPRLRSRGGVGRWFLRSIGSEEPARGSTSIWPRDHDIPWMNADVTKLVRGEGRGEY